jgi:hypothetical protein
MNRFLDNCRLIDPIKVSYSGLGLSWSFIPSIAEQDSERPGAVKGAPLFGAASANP